MKKEREQKYEAYNHNILWSSASKIIKLSRTSGNDEPFHSLAGMLMLYFAFEGYLNWLGNTVEPEVWKKERALFSRPPHQGTLGKYHYLAEKMLLQIPDKSQGPFQTAKDLQMLRDESVHPRPESGERSVKFADPYFPPHYRSRLATKVSSVKRDRAEKDIKRLALDLHQAAQKHYPEFIDIAEPFGGNLGFDSTDA